jgi:putative nucleotidyltransferase with HDIG domain
MDATSSKSKQKIRTKVFVPATFIVAILLITYIFPRQGQFKYSFSEGRPWQYNTVLIAPFDFPIYKPPAQLRAEQDSILAYFEPHFVIDENVKTNALTEFDADINSSENLRELPFEYILYIRNRLIEIYTAGVISSEQHDLVSASPTRALRIRTGNIARSVRIEEFFTIRSAYERVISSAPVGFDLSLLRLAYINEYIRENVIYDAVMSERVRQELIQQIDISRGMVQQGERIIGHGEIITPHIYNILSSLKRVTEERTGGTERGVWVIIGQLLLVSLMLGALYMYLLFFKPEKYRNQKSMIFLLSLTVVFVVLTALTMRFELFSVYIIPYAIVAILIRTFIDSTTSLFVSLITILICSLMVASPFEFVLIQTSVMMISIFILRELSERLQLIRSAFLILLTYIFVYIGIVMYQQGSIMAIDAFRLLHFLINFIFVMFAYSLVYLVEKMFGFVSGVTLVELSNINKPLLKELSEKAPGTFQHSLQVSNLGMAAAARIGANASLIRTGALYHDIGKILNPAYFTENQTPGANPHADLPFEESAKIIINHVGDGVKIAKKRNLPQQIIDFIETHHGKSMAKFFYISWKNANPDKEVNDADFQYPGPNPFSKETAIMMMADAVEASSRSLPEYTEETIRNLVDNIIDTQLNEGYFKNAPITFRDIQLVKDVFVDKLKTVYHSRITYPELKSEEEVIVSQKIT